MFLVFSCHRSSITLSRCRCHEAKKCRVPSSCTVLCYRYLECGSGGSSGLVTACLERLTCITHDRKIKLPARDREVAAMLVSFTIFLSLKSLFVVVLSTVQTCLWSQLKLQTYENLKNITPILKKCILQKTMANSWTDRWITIILNIHIINLKIGIQWRVFFVMDKLLKKVLTRTFFVFIIVSVFVVRVLSP